VLDGVLAIERSPTASTDNQKLYRFHDINSF
jgi:hypothetical protein